MLALQAVGCRGGNARELKPAVRDSAGVVVVDNPDQGWAGSAAWQVQAVPVLTIGDEDAGPEYRFTGVQGALRLRNGMIVIADQSPSIRFYATDGRFLSSTGRDGAGPGEFRRIGLIRRLVADSLVIWDPVLRRATLLLATGVFGQTHAAPSAGGFLVVIDAFPDGALLALHLADMDPRGYPPGVRESSVAAVRLNPATNRIDTLALVAGGSTYLDGHGAVISIPFSTRPVLVASDSTVHGGSGRGWEIRTYALNGALRRVLRLRRPNPALTRGMIDTMIERLTNGVRSDDVRRRIEGTYRSLPYPSATPAYSRFLLDPLGNLWVLNYQRNEDDLGLWTVFDSTGRLLGDVRTPPRFSLFEVGENYILGVARDTLQVEQVQVLRLDKGF